MINVIVEVTKRETTGVIIAVMVSTAVTIMIVIGVASIGTIATIAEAIGDSTDMIAVLQYGLAVMLYKVITQNVLSGNTA